LIIEDANDKELSQTFVVFDIETTGFSNTNDKITEIGAVKIENHTKQSFYFNIYQYV
ncbi:exonuclease domain-containing protein, partial [Clostridioides difficile]|uniref:exonuclease domain-containing protein n=1 Tax=Clostridioides difficile TaxID=1496 RepID=UPI003F8D4851